MPSETATAEGLSLKSSRLWPVPAAVIVTALQAAAAGIAYAKPDPVWIVGGGPDVFRSQVQIERNVLWAVESMAALPGEREVKIFFTDGEDPGPDVHEWLPSTDEAASVLPLARVFDSYWTNGLSYRSHRIPGVAGTTEAESLAAALGDGLGALRPDAGGWFLFIGHGTRSEDLDNSIELWNRSRLRVSDVQRLFDLAPPEARLRFLFTQCYSGAFARLAAPGTNRCGFLAESADDESEGCSAAVEKRDYEDYSTYFFAALTGLPRNHAGLDGLIDRNADGVVTPLEAHFHVLSSAYSADIPRSTSESLLMQWQPWYLPLAAGLMPSPDNEYSEMARELMRRVGINPEAAPEQGLEAELRKIKDEMDNLRTERERLQQEIGAIETGLTRRLVDRWPDAGSPYTFGFKRFLEQDLAEAQAFISAQPEYFRLSSLQKQLWDQVDQDLDQQRRFARLKKIEHLLRLARQKGALAAFGPEALKAHYSALRECESAPF